MSNEILAERKRSLDRTLEEVTLAQKIAFGAACAERLLPNYFAFCQMEKVGDFGSVRDALDLVWRFTLIGDGQSLGKIDLQAIIDLVPDDEDYNSLLGALGANAVSAVVYLIEACRRPLECADKVAIVSRLTYESVIEYLAIVNAPNPHPHIDNLPFYDALYSYPLFVAEDERQLNDLLLISKTEPNETLIDRLRSVSVKEGIQPMARGLLIAAK